MGRKLFKTTKTSGAAIVLCALAFVAAPSAQAQGTDDLLGEFDTPAPAPKPKEPQQSVEELEAQTKARPAAAPAAAPKQEASAAPRDLGASAVDKIKAVPRKRLLKRRRVELSPFFGLSLNDPYYQHLSISGAATYYVHDAFGIGVGLDYLYAHPQTGAVDEVRENLISVPPVFEHPQLFAHLDAYWVPIYGKVSLFDSFIVHFDLYATMGVGMAKVARRTPPAANVGLGYRFVLADWLALRLEVRDHAYVDTVDVNGQRRSDVQNHVLFFAGASFFVPPSFEYTY